MGQLAQATQGQQLAAANPQGNFKALLKSQWSKISEVLPKNMSAERFFQLAVSAYNSEPKLAQCSTVSVLSCVMKCAALGLEPSAVDGLGRAYILPYRNKKTRSFEATFMLGYKGMIQLARNSGEIKSISARAVYEGDVFHYAYGLNEELTHEPMHKSNKLIYTYCVAHFKDGGHYFVVLSRDEIDKARQSSQAGSSGPWATHYDMMAIKTAIRRAFPYLPVSTQAQEAAASDETTPDYSGVLNPIIEQPAPIEVAPVAAQNAEIQADAAPVGVDPETGEIGPDFDPTAPEIEIADEDIPFPDEA
jgi:recombination protein RecT